MCWWRYADRVDGEFKDFMAEIFPPGAGKAPDWHVWAGGPVKRTKRMYVKIREDLMQDDQNAPRGERRMFCFQFRGKQDLAERLRQDEVQSGGSVR